jgi:hypothetical protein
VRKGGALLFVAAATLAATLSLTGCDDADSHIYTGEPYDPTLACLAPLQSVDVVAGPEPMTPCSPICILSGPQDGGIVAYVSTMCGPYPNYPNQSNEQSDPLCLAALNAFTRDALCEDGGVVLPPSDAAADADASGDGDAGTGDAATAADGTTAADAAVGVDAGGDGASE